MLNSDGREHGSHRADRITPACTYHGEGPFWDSRYDRLLLMDVLEGTIVSFDPATNSLRRHALPSPAATVIRHRACGGYVIATERAIVVADDALETFTPLKDLVRDPAVRTNDGGCDPFGAFVIGTMSHDGKPNCGAVYRLEPDNSIATLLSPVSISNGVQWSGDGSHVYYVDTPTRRVDCFDVDATSGEWLRRRTHIDLESAEGLPDGMAIDIDDGLWIALWGGGMVNHYDASGRLVDSIRVPGVSQVSSCAFGGPDRNVLYITTSRQGLPVDLEPDAGAVFAFKTPVQGAPQAAFGG